MDPAWMTAALRSRLPDVVVEAIDLMPAGDGTNARARASLSCSGRTAPSSVFVKAPGRPAHRVALLALGALATEARLADAGVSLPVEHPVLFGGGVEWGRLATIVVMEDVVAAGSRPLDPRTPLTVQEVRSGLAGLASLHAAHWGRPFPASLGFLRAWRLGPTQRAMSVASLARGLQRARAAATRDVADLSALRARDLGAQFGRSASIAASGPETLLHGDPHPGNAYVTAGGRTGFFDWQLARRGQWSHDVGYFLVGSLDPGDRRRHEEELLEGYLAALERGGVDAPPRRAAWDRYRGTPAFGLATWLHTLSFGTLQPFDVCAEMIRRFAVAYDDLGTASSDVAGP